MSYSMLTEMGAWKKWCCAILMLMMEVRLLPKILGTCLLSVYATPVVFFFRHLPCLNFLIAFQVIRLPQSVAPLGTKELYMCQM
jgi:hypothetical protein